jgi:hypothetical protein
MGYAVPEIKLTATDLVSIYLLIQKIAAAVEIGVHPKIQSVKKVNVFVPLDI